MMHNIRAEEYQTKKGWGHSSMEDTIQYAELNGVKKLLLTHHDPMHSDKQLTEIQCMLKRKTPGSMEFEMAREGLTIEL